MTKTLHEILDAPLRGTYRGGRGKNFKYDPEDALLRWKSNKYPSIQALADSLGAQRTSVSRLLRQRGLIE
jgi:hypothetical protein